MFVEKKVKLERVVEIINSVNIILGLGNQQTMPIKLGYKLKRWSDELKSVSDNYNEKRNELIKKYGEKGGDGNYSVSGKDEAKKKKFDEETEKLLSTTETIKVLDRKIKLDEFGGLKIVPQILYALEDYLELD